MNTIDFIVMAYNYLFGISAGVYGYFALINYRHMSFSKAHQLEYKDQRNRFLFGMAAFALCTMYFILVDRKYSKSFYSLLILTIYFTIILNTFFYSLMMEKYYRPSRRLKYFIHYCCLISLLGIAFSIYDYLYRGNSLAVIKWVKSDQVNLMTWGNGHFLEPTPNLLVIYAFLTITQFTLLISLAFGYKKGYFQDKIILTGLCFSLFASTWEALISDYFPQAFCYILFAANFPEFLRITLLEQSKTQKLLVQEKIQAQVELIQKEKSLEKLRLSSINNLSSGMAHEINNPLAIIQVAATYLERSGEKCSQEKKEALILKINSAVKRIASIVQSLRLIGDRNFSTPEPTTIQVILEHAKQELENIFQEQDTQNIIYHIHSTQILMLDRLRLSQALFELLKNALIHSQKSTSPQVFCSIFEEKDKMIIEVKNNGEMIDLKKAKILSDPFFSDSTIAQGKGLGLAIVGSISDFHNGTLTYRIRDAHTIVSLSIPLVAHHS